MSMAFDWFARNPLLSVAMVLLSLCVSIGGLWAIRCLIIWLPADHFTRREPRDSWRRRHPAIRWTLVVVKNVVGLAIFVMGVVMLFTPGPGVLGILMGLSLMDIPGKHALVVKLVTNPAVLRQLNAMRTKAGRLPIEIPAPCESVGSRDLTV